MLEFYKTFEDGTRRIAEPEPGCWINAVAPTEEERNFLIEQIGILPEFVKSSLDEEESSHIDYDDDFRQVLIIFDYPSAENEDDDSIDSTYSTLPIGIVILKGYVVTISLYENWSILEMSQGRIKGMDTRLKTRFFLLLALRISQRFLICLRQIDRLSSRTETRLHQSVENDELIEMLGLEKSLVYFSTSLKSISSADASSISTSILFSCSTPAIYAIPNGGAITPINLYFEAVCGGLTNRTFIIYPPLFNVR